jgi:hypothetical protein
MVGDFANIISSYGYSVVQEAAKPTRPLDYSVVITMIFTRLLL